MRPEPVDRAGALPAKPRCPAEADAANPRRGASFMSDSPIVAAHTPAKVSVEEGKSYYWCTCGRSKNQPFCDGSHAGTGLSPLEFKAERSESVHLCQCKATGSAPFCDGSHRKLADVAEGEPVPAQAEGDDGPPTARPTPEEPTVALIHQITSRGARERRRERGGTCPDPRSRSRSPRPVVWSPERTRSRRRPSRTCARPRTSAAWPTRSGSAPGESPSASSSRRTTSRTTSTSRWRRARTTSFWTGAGAAPARPPCSFATTSACPPSRHWPAPGRTWTASAGVT